mmetsp:Transcript_9686/g.22375  ORF Transcript_9686/g.22375 Transcript_9686/m.22375 type:complete len:250 (-) Transcript_9686:336-1085(-)
MPRACWREEARPERRSICAHSSTTSVRTSLGPAPCMTAIASCTSTQFPTASPRGCDMSVMSATLRTPASSPALTMLCASSMHSSTLDSSAPLPLFTSSTSDFVPSAIFFDMIEDVMSESDLVVPVWSRRRYTFLSTGAMVEVAPKTATPMSESCDRISELLRFVRMPGIASSLLSVPPVCPRLRPLIIGTAKPQLDARGAKTRETLSPTPPVECLSAAGMPNELRSILSPLLVNAMVRAAVSASVIPRK